MSAKILLGVSGSIAAYKAADLVRLLRRRGWEVSVMMTRSATAYVGPLTFRALTGRPVAAGEFHEEGEHMFLHIDLARWADLVLVAPCTANLLAKLAHGLADDIVSATALASRAPLMVAPAMNTAMWENPATRANVATLKERGVQVLDTEAGELACGEVGEGRLLAPEVIAEAVAAFLAGLSGP